eukprot:TRINITY_DN3258_c2_g2_i6.p1 TRINITY_DN3258_c2_g2~~TRINITY_DN3258_c2_g2_i6.p1  ORF type:complete len:400 (+),score=87.30 TRINITY_DN3258_c2_g2_i6:517-1716(+)
MSNDSELNVVEKTLDSKFQLRIDEENVKTIEGLISHHMKDCKYSFNGKYVAVVDYNKTVFVFNGKTGEVIRSLQDHRYEVYCVGFSPNGQFMATCSLDSSIIIYSIPSFSIYKEIKSIISYYFVFSECSKFLYCGDINGYVHKMDVDQNICTYSSKLHSSSVYHLSISSNGKYLLSCTNQSDAKLILLKDMSIVQTFERMSEQFIFGCFHPFEDVIALASLSKKVIIWTFDGSIIQTVCVEGNVFSLKFITSLILLFMSGDGFITLYNAQNQQRIQSVFCGCEPRWFSFDVSPDRTNLICGRCDLNNIKIYPLLGDYSLLNPSEFVDLSRQTDSVLLNLIRWHCNTSFLRIVVAKGIRMNFAEFKMIYCSCWDLVDINGRNGGNMANFIELKEEQSDDD